MKSYAIGLIGVSVLLLATPVVAVELDTFFAESEKLISILESIQDSNSADASAVGLQQQARIFVDSIPKELVDRFGNSQADPGDVQRAFDIGKRLGEQLGRVDAMDGLSEGFKNSYRPEFFRIMLAMNSAGGAGQSNPILIDFLKNSLAFCDRYGAEKVVSLQVKEPAINITRVKAWTKKIQATSEKRLNVTAAASNDAVMFTIAPVEDFEQFCSKLNLGKEVRRDVAGRSIVFDNGSTASASSGPQLPAKLTLQVDNWEAVKNTDKIMVEAKRYIKRKVELQAEMRDPRKRRQAQDELDTLEREHVAELRRLTPNYIGTLLEIYPRAKQAGHSSGTAWFTDYGDFDAFCDAAAKLGEIVHRDKENLIVNIILDPSKMSKTAPHYARWGRNIEDTPNSPVSKPQPISSSPKPDSEKINTLPERTSKDYYEDLCKLMVAKDSWPLNDRAIEALVRSDPQEVKDSEVRKQIARNFRQLALKDDPINHGLAVRGLVLYGGKFSVPVLIELMGKDEKPIDDEIFAGLANLKDERGAEAVCQQLGSIFNHEAAVDCLRQMGAVAETALMKAAPSKHARISLAAIELLGDVGTEKSIELLKKADKSKDAVIREAAAEAIKKIESR